MAQYKSFASQGSFSDFQMTAPDQSAKIEREAQRQLRGMERAQAFTEKNQAVIGQAMREAQATEKQLRDQNFKSETEYRRAYRQAEAANFQTEIENDAAAAKAQSQAYKDLSEFSQTAFKLFGTINETVQKAEIGVKHKLALDAGLDLEDLAALRGIEDKLNRSQFNQLEFIQRKINEGASATQINALYEVFKRSGSNQWYEMKSLYQNSAIGHSAFLEEGMQDMFEDGATPSLAQINARIESLNAKYIETKFAGARPEILESSGVYAKIRQNSNTLIAGFQQNAAKRVKDATKEATLISLNTIYRETPEGNSSGIISWLNANPSKENRDTALGWIAESVTSGAITPEQANAILENPTLRVGNKDTSLKEQFAGFESLSKAVEAVKAARRGVHSEWALDERERQRQVSSDVFEELSGYLKTQGNLLTREQFDEAEARLKAEGVSTEVLEQFRPRLEENFTGDYWDSKWTQQSERSGGIPPSYEEINDALLDNETKKKWIQERQQYDARVKLNKPYEDEITKLTKSKEINPMLNPNSITVGNMVQKRIAEFRYLTSPKVGLTAQEAFDRIQGRIIAEGKSLTTFDTSGNYASVMGEIEASTAASNIKLENLNRTVDVIKKQPKTRRDFKELSTALSASVVYAELDNLAAGRKTGALFNSVAYRLNMSPRELGDVLAKANGLDPIKTSDDKILEDIRKRESQKDLNLRNRWTSEPMRRQRYVYSMSGGGSAVNLRGSFSNSREKEALNIIAKYESTSKGGYDAVNQGGADDGNTVLGYSGPFSQMTQHRGRALTDLTIQEIMDLQYDPGSSAMSMQEWINSGKLHAVGRYQFIGSTLAGVVQQMGIDPNTKFTPEVQDQMALWLLRNSSNGLGQWVGPTKNATEQERALVNAVR